MDDIIDKFGDLSVSERPKMPKGKRTAYSFFMQYISADMKKKGDTYSGLGQFSKICSQKWKKLSDKEKEKYQRMSREDITRYDKEIAEYEKHKNSYDLYVDEIHDKGYLQHLDDNRHVMEMTILSASSATKKSGQSKSDDTDDNDNNLANDTIKDLITKKKSNKISNNKKQHIQDSDVEEEEEEEDEEDPPQIPPHQTYNKRRIQDTDEDEEEEDSENECDTENDQESQEGEDDDEEDDQENGDNSGCDEDDDQESSDSETEESDDSDNPKNKMKPRRRLF